MKIDAKKNLPQMLNCKEVKHSKSSTGSNTWVDNYLRAQRRYYGAKNGKEVLERMNIYAGSDTGTGHVAYGVLWSALEATARWAWDEITK